VAANLNEVGIAALLKDAVLPLAVILYYRRADQDDRSIRNSSSHATLL